MIRIRKIKKDYKYIDEKTLHLLSKEELVSKLSKIYYGGVKIDQNLAYPNSISSEVCVISKNNFEIKPTGSTPHLNIYCGDYGIWNEEFKILAKIIKDD